MSIEKAIELLREYYERAQKYDYVKNKVAWALYQTWRRADK